jgi:arabinofuranosyltransferase
MTSQESRTASSVPETEARDDSERFCDAVHVALVAASAAVVASQAWIGDDALISVRAIANTIAGNGATFNVLERVQVYTSPLWFWLQVAANAIHFDPILWAMLLGIVCTVGFTALLVRSARSTAIAAAVTFVLVSSPAFIEWGTSGLENSLGYVLVAAVALASQRYVAAGEPNRAAVLGVTLALLCLTRHDLILLGGPIVVGSVLARRGGRHTLVVAAAAALPIVVWSALSYAYYGYALPNTAYAKLNVDIPLVERLARGLNYLRMFGIREPQAALPLVLALVAAYVAIARRHWHILGAGAGIGLYLGYVVSFGGDFMEGRFLAIPLALSAVIVCTTDWNIRTLTRRPHRMLAVGLAAWVALGVVAGGSTPWLPSDDDGPEIDFRASGNGGVADERGFWLSRRYDLWSLIDMFGGRAGVVDAGELHLMKFRRSLASWPAVDPRQVTRLVETCGELGRIGIVEGPAVHVMDFCALADPVLARVPFRASGFRWRPGHYPRAVPEGYRTAVISGDSEAIVDPEIRRLFVEVASKTRPR